MAVNTTFFFFIHENTSDILQDTKRAHDLATDIISRIYIFIYCLYIRYNNLSTIY